MTERHLGSRAWDAVLAENANVTSALRRAQRVFDEDAAKLQGDYRAAFARVLRPRFTEMRDALEREILAAMREALRRGLPLTGEAPLGVRQATERAVRISKEVHLEIERLLAEQEKES